MRLLATPAAKRARHDLRQSRRRLDRRLRPLPHDGARDAPAARLLAEPPDEVGQLALRKAIDEITRGDALLRVEAHVERSLVTKREPPLGLVELRRRQTEIEQNPIQRRDPMLSGNCSQFREVCAHRYQSFTNAW